MVQSLTIKQKVASITVYAQEPIMTRFTPFDFTATSGQDEFVLDTIPVQVVGLYINGTAQNEEAGDFTVSGKTITLSDGVDSGDHVFGIYQEVGSA